MSLVTNVLLLFSLLEDESDDTCGPLNTVQAYLSQGNKLADARAALVTHKTFEHNVWIAAANFLDTDEFVGCVTNAGWQYPDEVQLLMKEQWDETFIDRLAYRPSIKA